MNMIATLSAHHRKTAVPVVPFAYDINITGTAFAFRGDSAGSYNGTIDWGDGTVSNINSYNDADLAHTYPTSGTYRITINGEFYILLGNTFLELLSIKNCQGEGASPFSFYEAAFYYTRIAVFPFILLGDATSLYNTWANSNQISSFPLIDTSLVENFTNAWRDCTNLASFPIIDLSSALAVNGTWMRTKIVSFPAIEIKKATDIQAAWYDCNSLENFPPNVFDEWNATPISGCFYNTWYSTDKLTAQSVENILVSIAVSGVAIDVGLASRVITIGYDVATGSLSAASLSAIATLKSRAWQPEINGVLV